MKYFCMFLFILPVFFINADFLLLKEIDPVTGKSIVLEGKVKKKKGEYILTTSDGSLKTFTKNEVIDIFSTEKKYLKYKEENENSLEFLLELESEAKKLQSIVDTITDDPYITVRYSDSEGYEFYQFKKRINTKREMVGALKEYRVAMKEYELLYRKYMQFSNVASAGVAISFISGVTSAVFGIYALASNNIIDRPAGFNLELSNQAMMYGAGVSGGIFLTGVGITIGGVAGRLHTRLKFVEPVEKYNQWLVNKNKVSLVTTPAVSLEFSFQF